MMGKHVDDASLVAVALTSPALLDERDGMGRFVAPEVWVACEDAAFPERAHFVVFADELPALEAQMQAADPMATIDRLGVLEQDGVLGAARDFADRRGPVLSRSQADELFALRRDVEKQELATARLRDNAPMQRGGRRRVVADRRPV